MPKTDEPPKVNKVKKSSLEQAYEMVMRLAPLAIPQPVRQEPKPAQEPRAVRTITTYGAVAYHAPMTDA